MKSIILGGLVLFAASAAHAQAIEEAGRFQAVVTTPQNSAASPAGTGNTRVMIVDTATGDLWEYVSQPQIGTIQGGWSVKYLTKLRRGSKPNEEIEVQSFARPQPIARP